MIPTKEKLAQVLHAHGLFDLEKRARAGDFDDFESESATPIMDLVTALEHVALFCTHSDKAGMTRIGERFADTVIDVWGEVIAIDPSKFDPLARKLREIA
jgi:hypothetical protein